MTSFNSNVGQLAGRILISILFLMAGIGKLGGGFEATQAYMQSMGVPGMLLPAVIALEIGGALLIMAGLWTRTTALALAAFTILSAALFHGDFSQQIQQIMFLKNMAIAGGFLFLASIGAGSLSIDARRADYKPGVHA